MNDPENATILEVPPGATPDDPGAVAAVPGVATLARSDEVPQAPAENEVPTDDTPRKRGRPSKADIAARLNGVTPPPPKPAPFIAPAPAAVIAVDYNAMGIIAASMWFGVGELALGSDWAPDNDEKMPIKDAFAAYFKSIGATDIPPGWVLFSALTIYTVKRIDRPTIKTRIFGAFSWVKSKFKR